MPTALGKRYTRSRSRSNPFIFATSSTLFSANSALSPLLSQLPTHFTSAADPRTIRVHGGSTMDSKQVVFITGSSTGFGRLFAETLARAGHTVFATMRDPQGKNAKNAADLLALARRESLPIFAVPGGAC